MAASALGVGDFDNDGMPDIAAETHAGDLIAWLATGVFAESEYSQLQGGSSLGMVVADLNGDRADDVATATWRGNVIVSRNAPGVQAAPASLSSHRRRLALPPRRRRSPSRIPGYRI